MKHIITALVENQPGVLARIVGLISGRGFNIESVCVAPTHDPSQSRLTMTVPGDDRVLEQVNKQLNKLVDVIKVSDLTSKHHMTSELALMEVAATPAKRVEILAIAAAFDAKIVAVGAKSLTLRMVGSNAAITDLLALLKPYTLLDLSRTGVIALATGGD